MSQSKRGRPKVEVVKSPDFKRIHIAGVMYGGHTPSEFRLGLYQEGLEMQEGVMSQTPPEVTLKREIVVEIVLPPVTAKMLAERLGNDIALYEKNIGKIPSPPKGKTLPPPKGIYT